MRLFPLIAALLLATPALAWDNQGHRVTGELAYDRLAARDPAAVRAIVQVMASHPDRARFDRSLADLSGPERERKLFGLMARWPDDIRHTAEDRPRWHYALKVVHGWTRLGFYTFGDALTQMPANRAVAFSRAAPSARAIALCWVFHITGDMHQPLHRGHRLDRTWPQTDRAGTVAWVRVGPGRGVTSLHEVWDHGISLRAASPAAEDAAVRTLHAALAPAARVVPVSTPASYTGWVAETEYLARTVAYSGSALGAARRREDAPVLAPAYMRTVRAVATRRVVQAGAHLGDVLRGFR